MEAETTYKDSKQGQMEREMTDSDKDSRQRHGQMGIQTKGRRQQTDNRDLQ